MISFSLREENKHLRMDLDKVRHAVVYLPQQKSILKVFKLRMLRETIIHSIHSLKKNYCRVKTKSPAPSCYNKDCHSKALQTVFIAKCGKSYRRDFFQCLHPGENIQRRETGFLVEKAKVQYLSMWKQLKNKKGKQSLPYSKSRLDDRQLATIDLSNQMTEKIVCDCPKIKDVTSDLFQEDIDGLQLLQQFGSLAKES